MRTRAHGLSRREDALSMWPLLAPLAAWSQRQSKEAVTFSARNPVGDASTPSITDTSRTLSFQRALCARLLALFSPPILGFGPASQPLPPLRPQLT